MRQIIFNKDDTVYIGHTRHTIQKTAPVFVISSVPDTGFSKHFTQEEAYAILRHAPYDVPDEKPKAVFADAKTGDSAFHVAWGTCTIELVVDEVTYPIGARDKGGNVIGAFTLDGLFDFEDSHPTLFKSLQHFIDYWKAQGDTNA